MSDEWKVVKRLDEGVDDLLKPGGVNKGHIYVVRNQQTDEDREVVANGVVEAESEASEGNFYVRLKRADQDLAATDRASHHSSWNVMVFDGDSGSKTLVGSVNGKGEVFSASSLGVFGFVDTDGNIRGSSESDGRVDENGNIYGGDNHLVGRASSIGDIYIDDRMVGSVSHAPPRLAGAAALLLILAHDQPQLSDERQLSPVTASRRRSLPYYALGCVTAIVVLLLLFVVLGGSTGFGPYIYTLF
jgi:hypothetical protein